MIAKRILKIDFEIAEIIEVNWHFAITQSLKTNFGVTGANFDLNYLSYVLINGYNKANIQGCSSWTRQNDKKQSGSNILGRPVYWSD